MSSTPRNMRPTGRHSLVPPDLLSVPAEEIIAAGERRPPRAHPPLSGRAELRAKDLSDRRRRLFHGRPFAAATAAKVCAAMQEACPHGTAPKVTGDQKVRYRRMQLAGQKPFDATTEFIVMATDNAEGRAVAIAFCRALLAELEPAAAPATDPRCAALAVVANGGRVIDVVATALQDNQIDDSERTAIVRALDADDAAEQTLRAALAAGGAR